MTQKTLTITFATLGWFAVIAQYVLMMENRIASPVETTIRFFSFFTILTNLLVAFYFTIRSSNPQRNSFATKSGTLTAITLYITIVGLVYQLVLRQIWDPQGLQKVVDELLHSVIPVCTLIYWWFYEQKVNVRFQQIKKWLLYPLAYLIFILIRGGVSGFYPYPFVNVTELGYQSVIVNSIVMLVVFVGVAVLLIWVGRRFGRAKNV